MKLKPFRVRFAGAILASTFCVLAAAISVQADTLTVNGTTQGSFDGSAFSSHATLTGNILGFPTTAIEFQGQPFSTAVLTDGVTASIVQVGSIDLRTFSNFNFNGHTFNLLVTFLTPPVGSGNPATFQAMMSGTITANEIIDGNESVTIDFDNTPQVFSYAGGSFTFTAIDLTVSEQAGFVPINARLTAQTPEPVSMFLLGTGLTGLAIKVRRAHRRSQDA